MPDPEEVLDGTVPYQQGSDPHSWPDTDPTSSIDDPSVTGGAGSSEGEIGEDPGDGEGEGGVTLPPALDTGQGVPDLLEVGGNTARARDRALAASDSSTLRPADSLSPTGVAESAGEPDALPWDDEMMEV